MLTVGGRREVMTQSICMRRLLNCSCKFFGQNITTESENLNFVKLEDKRHKCSKENHRSGGSFMHINKKASALLASQSTLP